MVNTGQLILLATTIGLFVAGGFLSALNLKAQSAGIKRSVRALLLIGILCALGLLIWHALSRTSGNWLPLEDNFEAMLWLAILLSAFVLYVQFTRPVGGLDWFVLPVVVVLLVLAGFTARSGPLEYVDTTWSWVHRLTSFGGAAAFTIAGAAGAMYLVVSRRLRSKSAGPPVGNLERLERLTYSSVILGFALLTVGVVAGLIWQLRMERIHGSTRLGPRWYLTPKVLLASAVWVVYALVLHSRIAPVLRGRKVAVLSIVGCLLMVATLIALNLLPGGGMR